MVAGLSRRADAQRFYPDDPVWVDPDNVVFSHPLSSSNTSEVYDFLRNTFASGSSSEIPKASNINTLGEVPDSAWFQNRHQRARLTDDELQRGPNTTDGPSREGRWTVVSAKTAGATPGFQIRDANGVEYLLKLDLAEYPEMSSATEIIVTKFFYAAGYHVPENYLVYFNADRLTTGGGKVSSTDVERVLEKSYRDKKGRFRAVASKLLKGRPVGPFQYYGTRRDDPNDIFEHQNRRELRGLRVIASWLNHDDIRSANTLDMLTSDADGGYVRHYLIDFGSSLGSGTIRPTDRRTGHEYLLEWDPLVKRLASFGLWQPEWTRIDFPNFPSIGRFESKHFYPGEWKPEYPNRAFDSMQLDDAYWAARIVMSFSDDDIRAIVQTGELSDPAAEKYLARTLSERRNKIGEYWLTQLNSADRFAIQSGTLTFEHLASVYGVEPAPAQYSVTWFEYANEDQVRTSSEAPVTLRQTTTPIPVRFTDPEFKGYFGAEIAAPIGDVVLYIRKTPAKPPELVGIERTVRKSLPSKQP